MPPDASGDGRSLSERIIRMGAIAAAIVTILGLARLLWPDPTPRRLGELADVSVVTKMTLSEFAERQKLGSAETKLLLASANSESSISLALASAVGQETPSPTPTNESSPSPSPSPSPTENTEVDMNCLACSDEVAFEFEQVQDQLPPEELPEGCRYTSKGELRCSDEDVMELIMPPEDITIQGGLAMTSSQKLLEILDGTRNRRLSEGGTVPIGVAISFDLSLEGFLNRRVDVRWSLFSAGKGAMVPQDYLVNRRAIVATPEAIVDRASGEFWIPLPRERGPYFARVSAWHQDERLDFSDSPPFN